MATFETKTDSKGRVWHRHGMPDAGTDSHSEARLAAIYATKSGTAWHWASDAHSVNGEAHGEHITRSMAPRTPKVTVTLADVLEAEQADLQALADFAAQDANRLALQEFSGMSSADAVEAASFITSGKAKSK